MACVPVLKDRVGIFESKINSCSHLTASTSRGKLSAYRGEQKFRYLSCIPEGNGNMGFPKDGHLHQFYLSKDYRKTEDNPVLPPMNLHNDILLKSYVPVYVLLPVDVVKRENVFVSRELYSVNFRALKAAHVDGVRVQVWWGVVEAKGSRQYDWSAYKMLFSLIQLHGLKLKVSLCFHQHGAKSIDSYMIPLPAWVLKTGEGNANVFFPNKDAACSQEYLSFGVDNKVIVAGRSALKIYADFIKSFKDNMSSFIESGLITEVEVSLGSSGELRYLSNRQSYQCYDRYLSSSNSELLAKGSSNSTVLLDHANRMLQVSRMVFEGSPVKLGTKLADLDGHAVKFMLGHHGPVHDRYKLLLRILAKYKFVLNVVHDVLEAGSGGHVALRSEALVREILTAASCEGVEVVLENAVPVYSRTAFDRILKLARPDGRISDSGRRLSGFTFSRLGQALMTENNWREFVWFVRRMHAGLDFSLIFGPTPGAQPESSTAFITSMKTRQASVPPPVPSEESPTFFTRDAPGGGLGTQVDGDDGPESEGNQGSLRK